MFKWGFVFTLFNLLLTGSALAANVAEAHYSFSKSSPFIRSEGVNQDGMFDSSGFIRDPMRDRYNKSNWILNKKFKVLSSNDSANRIHIAYVGDGYTSTELSQYSDDVSTQMDDMFLQEPFRSYKNFFAFHRIETVSVESGVSPSADHLKNTALGMYYNCGGIERLLCIDLSKVAAAVQSVPQVDIIFALANSDKYGGAGYLDPAVSTFAAKNSDSREIAIHEIGHSFGKLTDEYEVAGADVNCGGFENTTSLTREELLKQKAKWFRWLDLPQIGTFKGSCYSQEFFRPTETSKMRKLHQPFAEINTEQLIKKIYEKVKPVDSVESTENLMGVAAVSVTPMLQVETPLAVEWSVDDQALPALNGQLHVTTAQLALPKGSHTLKVQVQDKTLRVRDEDFRKKMMTQTFSWPITIR